MKQKYTMKLGDELRIQTNSCRKKIEIIKETMNFSAECTNCFSDSVFKALLCHIPPRTVKTITKLNA